MPLSELLLGTIGTAGYDALKAALVRRFRGDPDDLAERLTNALGLAVSRFFTVYGARFPRAGASFLGRPDNLTVIGQSLHYSQPPLSPEHLDPRGWNDGPDATPVEVETFVEFLRDVMATDRFLDKHLRERDHMREAAEQRVETREVAALLRRLLGVSEAQAVRHDSDDPWRGLVVNDPQRSPGWRPEQGQIYSAVLPEGPKVEYMLHGRLLLIGA